MTLKTRITDQAHRRGLTAAEVARKLSLYPSNIAAMDAGKRSVSLQLLTRIAKFLDCGLPDLLEMTWTADTPLFRNQEINCRLRERDLGTTDGTPVGWVNQAMLAWQRHYLFRTRTQR